MWQTVWERRLGFGRVGETAPSICFFYVLACSVVASCRVSVVMSVWCFIFFQVFIVFIRNIRHPAELGIRHHNGRAPTNFNKFSQNVSYFAEFGLV